MLVRLLVRSALRCSLILTAAGALSSAVALAQTSPPMETPSVANVEARLAELDQATDLDADTAAALRGLYRETLSELESAARFRTQSLDYGTRVRTAQSSLGAVETSLATPPSGSAPSSVATLDEVEPYVAQLERQLEDATKRLVELDGEPLRRTTRRATIRQQLADLETQLGLIDAELAAPPNEAESPRGQSARRTLLAARRMHLANQSTALQQELHAYEAEASLLPRQRDLAARDARFLEGELRTARDRTNLLRRQDASRQASAAQEAVQEGYAGGLAALVDANAALAERRVAVADALQLAEHRRQVLRQELAALSERSERTRRRVDAVGQVPAMGLLLLNQRESLPNLRQYRRRIQLNEETTRSVQVEMFDLDEQRRQLADLDAAVATTLAEMGIAVAPTGADSEVAASVRTVLDTQRDYVDLLLADLSQYFDVLVEVSLARHQVVSEAEAFLAYIDERIAWTRSADAIGWSDLVSAWNTPGWLMAPDQWALVGQALLSDIASYPLLYVPASLLLVGLVRWRRRLVKTLITAGESVADPSVLSYGPTAVAFIVTIALAGMGPLAVWLVGHRLGALGDGGAVSVVSQGLTAMAVIYWPLALLLQLSRPHGLMTAHFAWSTRSVALLRRHGRWLLPSALPLTFVIAMMSSQPDPSQQDSLGRLSLILLQILFAVFLHQLLRPDQGLFQETLQARPAGWPNRLSVVWHLGAVAAPLVTAGLAAAGYMYTATQLVMGGLKTLWLAVGIAVVHGLMSRWALIGRRRLAIQQHRERLRVAMSHGAQSQETVRAAVLEQTATDLPRIDSQTRQLIRMVNAVAVVGGVWWIWSDMIPAMRILDRVTLWTLNGSTVGETQAFTLEDLALTLVLATTTALIARNVPTLIEMGLLKRLPLEGGVRYAITTLTRYVLAFIGIVVIVNVLGVTWSSVQWLVAAFGVGLGFGLQEIFANLVSGIILLFERPVRVGDTVTIGNATGQVSRIRMRATTILDWDMKELVVPNKDLVTGHLINWTLTDASNRVTISVGVAYGSDAAHVTRVLQEIVAATPRVLKVPAPIITFEEFGDSALKFTLRVYLSRLTDRLPVIHALHLAIAERFRDEKIEIAFPQLDVHVRDDASGASDQHDRQLSAQR